MRLRLILSFILIVIVAIVSVALIARRQTVSAVDAFIHRGGLSGTEGLVNNLEEYYATYATWEGVETFFERQGRGMGQHVERHRRRGQRRRSRGAARGRAHRFGQRDLIAARALYSDDGALRL